MLARVKEEKSNRCIVHLPFVFILYKIKKNLKKKPDLTQGEDLV